MKALPFLFALLSLLFLACARTTMVSGKVTNILTGAPVVGMPVSLWVFNGNEPKDSANPKKVGESNGVTNDKGEYALEISGIGLDAARLVLDGGWLCGSHFSELRSGSVRLGKDSEVNVQIDSIDAVLQVQLNHVSSPGDTLFLRVDCDTRDEKGIYCCNHDFATPVAPGNSRNINFRVTSGRKVPVYWGEQSFKSWDAPHIDSIFCLRNQTTVFVINY